MLLSKILDLRESIGRYREEMDALARKKGIEDPETIKISQELDQKIILLQRIILNKSFNMGSVGQSHVTNGLTMKSDEHN